MNAMRRLSAFSLTTLPLGVLALSGCMRMGTLVSLNGEPGKTARAVDQEVLSEAIDRAFARLSPPVFVREAATGSSKPTAAAAPAPVPMFQPPQPMGDMRGGMLPPMPMGSDGRPLPPLPGAPEPRSQMPAPPSVGDPNAFAMPMASQAAPTVLGGSGPAPLTAYIEVHTSVEVPQVLRDYAAARAGLAAARAGLSIKEVTSTLERQPGTGTERAYIQYPDTDMKVVVVITYAGVDDVYEARDLRHTERRGRLLVGRFKATFAIVSRNVAMTPYTEVVAGDARFDLDELKYTWDR